MSGHCYNMAKVRSAGRLTSPMPEWLLPQSDLPRITPYQNPMLETRKLRLPPIMATMETTTALLSMTIHMPLASLGERHLLMSEVTVGRQKRGGKDRFLAQMA